MKPEYYKTIHELPVYNWFNLHRTNNLQWLLKDHKVTLTKKIIKDLYAIFDALNDEFTDEFGFNDEFKDYLDKKKEVEMLKLDYMIDGDKSHLTFIEIAEKELEKINKEFEGGNYSEIKVALEKAMGFQINLKETSVYDYYNYIKFVQKNAPKVNG